MQELVTLLSGLIAYLPLVMVAIVILVIAAAIGNFLGDPVQPWDTSRNVPWVAMVARYAVIIFGALTALKILGIGRVSTRIFEFTFGAFAVAFAVAFGVGGIETARMVGQVPDTSLVEETRIVVTGRAGCGPPSVGSGTLIGPQTRTIGSWNSENS